MIQILFNILHILFIFFPPFIFFINQKYLKSTFKYILLIAILVPVHWVFFGKQCVLTVLSKKFGDLKKSETTSGFSEVYMKWLYHPIMKFIGWKWNSEGLSKIVNLHWIINIFILWYYLFFIGKENLL